MSDNPDDEARAADEVRGASAPLRRVTEDKPEETLAAAKPEVPAAPDGERIAKAIARAGIASRRDAEAMIEAGRVTLNGQVLASAAMNVTESDRITVDGEPLPARERTRLWILHKSRGVVTTARDPEGRQTVFDGLPDELPRVVAIGRLDINTEGLLLLTNDGGLAKVIAHPDTGWLRRYRVRAFGEVTQPDLDKLKKGVTIDGMEYGPVEASLDRAQGDNVWLTLGLREGKNREVKRILEHLGLSVNRLIRLSFGPFQLGDLEVGLVEEIRTKVLKEQLGKTLSEQAGVDFESPVREPIAPFGKPRKPADHAGRPAPRSTAPSRSERPDRPQRSERTPSRGGHFERPGRDPSRPARPVAPARVPTGGSGAGPRQSIWRADEEAGAERPHGTRIPRRGGDPKAARAAAAERGRERVGAIKTGERRVLVERLQPTAEVPAPEPHRRVRFRTRDDKDAGRPQQREPGAGAPQRRERFEDHGGHEWSGRERGAQDRGLQERRGPPGERPSGARPQRDRPSGNRPPRGEGRPGGFDRGARDRPASAEGGRREGGEGRGERSAGGFRGDKPAGARAGAGGGFKAGAGRPGGGYKAGGFKAGSERSGGGRPTGGFKGGKPGGRPGGVSSKPGPRDGGRPPRSGK